MDFPTVDFPSLAIDLPTFNIDFPTFTVDLPAFNIDFPRVDYCDDIRRQLDVCARMARDFAEAVGSIASAIDLSQWQLPLIQSDAKTKFMLDLGYVPHVELRRLIADHLVDEADRGTLAKEIAHNIWPELKPRLELLLDSCSLDEKLRSLFFQMLQVHELALYEITAPASVSVIERMVRLACEDKIRTNPLKWLRTEIADLQVDHLGGVDGFRTWQILVTHTFKNCWDDNEADSIGYPNRHAVAHGLGAKTANVVDSLNAVLIAHFVITAALALQEQRLAERFA